MPPVVFGLGRGRRVIERDLLVARRTWWIPLSGIAEPVFYLLSIGIGIGKLVGGVPGPDGTTIPYAVYVAPGLLAASAMNGAVFESTFNVYFKLRYAKIFDAMLATPVEATEVARGEITYALIRGAVYAAVFVVMMAGPRRYRLAVGGAGPAGGRADRIRLRGGRHGRHHLHAGLDRLRSGAAGAAAPLPVLHHLLPAVHLPAMAAAGRRVHAPLPGRQPGPGAHARLCRAWRRSATSSTWRSWRPSGWPSSGRRIRVLLLR